MSLLFAGNRHCAHNQTTTRANIPGVRSRPDDEVTYGGPAAAGPGFNRRSPTEDTGKDRRHMLMGRS
jgi:hypothetical protein